MTFFYFLTNFLLLPGFFLLDFVAAVMSQKMFFKSKFEKCRERCKNAFFCGMSFGKNAKCFGKMEEGKKMLDWHKSLSGFAHF